MHSRAARWRSGRATIAIVALSIGCVVPVSAVATGGQCHGIETVSGGWTAAPLPATPSLPTLGSSPITAEKVVGPDPSVAIASDGLAVFRTADGGCTWQTVLTLGASDYSTYNDALTGYSVTNIATDQDGRPANQQDVYLALSPNSLNEFTLVTLFTVAPPELFEVSHDGGRTFTLLSPQPTQSNPFVPECLAAPVTFFAAATDAKTLYMICPGGVTQQIAEEELAGANSTMYRSTDGGASWGIVGMPTYAQGGYDSARWFASGVHKNELWMGGYSVVSNKYYLTLWRSVDAGATWSALLPDPATPVSSPVSGGVVQLAVDNGTGAGAGQVAIFSAAGTYLSADAGRHWRRLRAVTFTNGARPPSAAFFLRHSLYVLFAGQIECRGLPVLVRYATAGAKPVSLPYPAKWGNYGGWATDATFTVVSRAVVGIGVAQFCAPGASGPTTSKLLSLRAH